MEFERTGDSISTGGGGTLTGIALGSLLNRRDDDRNSQWIWAVIIFIIFVVIALVFLAFMRKEEKREIPADYYGGNKLPEILATMIAAKGVNNDCNSYKANEFSQLYEKLEHNEDRATQRQTQTDIGCVKSELGAMGMLMQKTAADNEMKNLENFAKIENQLGALTMGMSQVLQTQNNAAIITGVVNQLMLGCKPCVS